VLFTFSGWVELWYLSGCIMLEMSETPLEWVLDNCVDMFIYFYMNKISIIFKPKFWNLSSFQGLPLPKHRIVAFSN
jgi:hypothetical protein